MYESAAAQVAVQQLKREAGKGLLVGGVKLPLALAGLLARVGRIMEQLGPGLRGLDQPDHRQRVPVTVVAHVLPDGQRATLHLMGFY
jgi:hypothetical protein